MYFAGTLHAAEGAALFRPTLSDVAMRGYNGNLELVSRSIT